MAEDKSEPKRAEQAPAPKAPRIVKPIAERSFTDQGVRQVQYEAIVEAGTTPDDVIDRGFFAHVAALRLRPFAKIHVICEDSSWYGELVVMRTFAQGALCAWIAPPVHVAKTGMIAESMEYKVYDGGLVKRWCVLRLRDNKNIHEGLGSEAEANTALLNFLRSQGSSRAA